MCMSVKTNDNTPAWDMHIVIQWNDSWFVGDIVLSFQEDFHFWRSKDMTGENNFV